MPVNSAVARRTWERYAYCRDHGHLEFMEKADKCDKYFAGDQWDGGDLALLRHQRRPAITINKIISTLANVMGEQIFNRSEISFRPRGGSPTTIADILTKVFKQISDNNQLDWLRSDVFADGVITSRGFYDVRLDFSDTMQGEVRITKPNPKNVVLDPDADEYDPDTWKDVIVTKWMTADDIAILYNKADSELLRSRNGSAMPLTYGFDSMSDFRDRFGGHDKPVYGGTYDEAGVTRNIRVLERQYKTLDKQLHFLAQETGDTRPVPEDFDRNRIAWFKDTFGFDVIQKLVHRIKWCVVADDIVLHEDWSPYNRFTIIPYFPYFRHGRTIGLVENLLGPQELLNKVSSQELHIVNTTANSGWKVRKGALTNMDPAELEQRGAETGLVVEVNGDPDKDLVKIQPNQIPSGLERISYKTEEHIKTISGVSDSMQGFDREDVAAKAIQAKRQAGSTNLAKPLDSLVRSDYYLARHMLDIVQEFYTEPRILTITKDRVTNESENISINEVTPEGQVLNDLTLGEYSVIVTSVPQRQTLEDSQFDQAVALRELGLAIPDEVLLDSSRLMNKSAITKMMDEKAQSEEAKAQAALQARAQEAEVLKLEGEGASKQADAQLKLAKAQKEAMPEQGEDIRPKMIEIEAKIDLAEREFAHEQQMDYLQIQEDRRQNQVEEQLQAQDLAEKRATQRAVAIKQANQPQQESTQ